MEYSFSYLLWNENNYKIQGYSKVDSGCKKPVVICNSIFSIILNQIKAQRDQKIILWIEYFPYSYSFQVISND
jgi:hypothetical protein